MSVFDATELETIGNSTVLIRDYCAKEVHFPKLTSINIGNNGKAGVFYRVLNTKQLYFESLTSIRFTASDGYFMGYDGRTDIDEIYIPKLTTYYMNGGINSFIGVSNGLKKLVFGKLDTFYIPYSQYMTFVGDAYYLIHFELGEGTSCSMNLKQFTCNGCKNQTNTLVENPELFTKNIEQFLYSYRHYFIDRLCDYTGGTKHTITFSKQMYDTLLGLDSEGYANTFHMPDEPSIDYVTSLNQKLTDINWGLAYV